LKLFKEINALKKFLQDERLRGVTKIGFVPTMGALHKGHLSLIKASKAENELTVCSIFVNPTQFNNTEDLDKYPRPIENDIKFLVENECDVLFFPEVKEMYIKDEIRPVVDYGIITNNFEGRFRPGHFDGVVMIVKKLFEIVEPNNAYFGQKDYQQCMVIDHFIKKNDLRIFLHVCPTLRESDNLAMSSRNSRLTNEERKAAVIIPETLAFIKKNIRTLPVLETNSLAKLKIINSSSLLNIEYLEIVDTKTLEPLSEITKATNPIVLIAAWCGNVRLIDNLILTD
jgi:pantoate--beta-alanine ligase